MSRTSSRLRAARNDEGGFTLVEVMAAMVVFALAATAVTAMLASGLRASLLTKTETTAKNLSQQRLESIRNLAFHIDQVSTGTNAPDLLDTYFVNTTGSAGRGQQGYVPAGASRWTEDGDPQTGAFYRFVQTAVTGFPNFKQYVATQFLDDSGAPYTPTGFNSQVVGSDTPPTGTVGVGVTTLWSAGELDRVSRVYSQISSGRSSAPTSVLQSRLIALRITGGMFGGQTLSLDLASLSADGSLNQSVAAAQALRGATMSLSGGALVDGALVNVKAPPNAAATGSTASSKSLTDGAFTYGGFGNSFVSGASASSSTGQIILNTSSSQATAGVLGAGAGSTVARFGLDTTTDPRLGLLTTHAYVADAGCGGSCTNVGVSGYAGTTKTTTAFSTSTSASATVRGTLVVFPTSYAPNGLLRLTLTSASVSCSVTRSTGGNPAGTATISYAGVLQYWAPFETGNVGGYKTVNVSSSDTTSPLTPELLAQTQAGTDPDGNPLWLSDYFASWSSMDTAAVSSAKSFADNGTTASVNTSGVVSVTTVPLDASNDATAIGVQVAVGSCTAEEYR